MRWRCASIGVAAALVTLAGSRSARAQVAPEGAPRVVQVEVEAGQPDASVQVQTGNGLLPCGQRCVLELPEGRYRVFASSANGRPSSQYLFVTQPSRVIVTPASSSARTASFVLMPIGAAGLATGVVLLWYALVRRFIDASAECPQGCTDTGDHSTPFLYAGGISLAIGMVVGVTGLVLWKQNKHARVDVEPLSARPAPGARLQLQPATGTRWAGLALTGAF